MTKPSSDTDRHAAAHELAKVVLVKEWEIDMAINGWHTIRCPECELILHPSDPMPPCEDYTTHELRSI